MMSPFFLVAQLAAGLRAHLEQRRGPGVSSIYSSSPESVAAAFTMAFQSPSGKSPRAQLAQVHAGLGAQNTLDELVGAHLQAEHGQRRRTGFRGVRGDVQSERCSSPTPGRAAKISRSPPRKPQNSLSTSAKPVGAPAIWARVVHELVNLVESLGEQVGDVLERGRHALLRDVEQHLLGFLDGLRWYRRARRRPSALILAEAYTRSRCTLVRLTISVWVLPVGKSERIVGELDQSRRRPAHGLELALGGQGARRAKFGR